MRLTVECIKRVECSVTRPFVSKVVRDTLNISGYDFLSDKHVSVNAVFVSPEEIRTLNYSYRQKDKVTDVLSFPEYDGKKALSEEDAEDVFLGELILCYDDIMKASVEDEVSLEQEMAYIVSHGILHLLGFHHSEKMFSLQDTVSEAYAQ